VLDARVTEIEGELRARALSYEEGLAARSRSLNAALAASSRQLSVIPAEQLQLARMERSRGSLESLFQTLTTRQKEAEIAAAVDLPSVSVVDFASRPDGPSSPKLPMNLGLGLVLGLAFGFGVSLVREHADTRIHGREELEEQTKLPIISIIPSLGKVRPALDGRAAGRLPRLQGEDAEIAGEAFRSLGVDLRLIIRGSGGDGLQTLAITSAGPGEGKTFTSCNLALMRAADGYRTLLIDADLRANGVGRALSLDRARAGLGDYLAGTATLSQALVEVGPLSVLPAGRPATRPAGLLERPRFGELLAEVRKRFDLVILDTPPLNVLADAASVSALVDGLVLVVRGGVTERDALALTLQRLERTGGHTLGIVLNDVRLPTRYASYSYRNQGGRDQHPQR
jgi:tyrosine-protein kinase Etk/Wzc